MNSGELKKAKRDVRKRVLALRDQLNPSQREALGRMALERLTALPQMADAGVVMVFWSFGSEIATAPLIDSLVGRGVRVALPKIQGQVLEARSWVPGQPSTPTAFGAREPEAGDEGAPVVAPELIDIVIVPAVAYDRCGRRVGYGGGFYDRFLPTTRPNALRIGLGFDVQLIEGDLPSGTFDTTVNLVVTSSEVILCSGN